MYLYQNPGLSQTKQCYVLEFRNVVDVIFSNQKQNTSEYVP
jgi:hypothetical protein